MELFLDDDSDVLLTDDQGYTSLHLAGNGSCQAPELQYLCILVLRKLVSHDLIQKISQLQVSKFLSNCMKNISLIDRV